MMRGGAGNVRTDNHAEKENVEHDVNISSLEIQIKHLLERSSGTVAKLDGQISKLDEQLTKNSASKRRRPRTPATARVVPSARSSAAGRERDAHPFNKWLVCIAGEDSSRAAESDPLHVTRPLTLDEISIGSPNGHNRKLPLSFQLATTRGKGERIATTPEQESDKAVRELASSPGARMPDYSFHAPSALSSRSPFSEERMQSPPVHARSPDLAFSPIGRGKREKRQDRVATSPAQPGSARESRPNGVDEEDLRKMEERMEAKLRSMIQSLSSEVSAHSAHSASKRDVEMLQSQVTRLKEEVVAAKSDVAVALKECRAARVAFASEHWSVKKLLEHFESFKKKHREDLLKLEQRASGAPKGSGKDQLASKASADEAHDGSARESVKHLELAVATLERQMTETAALANESTSSVSALKSLVEEVFEKCDAVQQTVSTGLAHCQDEAVKQEQGLIARCEELERGMESLDRKLTTRHSEADDSHARLCKDFHKTVSKVDELSSQLIANKAQALDMQSHLLVTLDEIKDKWQSVHMQRNGQLHPSIEWSHSLYAEVTSKADKALGKSGKAEAAIQSLQQALDRLLARLDRDEDEIKCLDNNILHVCSCIHALQAASRAHACTSPDMPNSRIPIVARGDKGVPLTQTPALSSQTSRKTPRSDVSSAQSSQRLHSAHSTYAANSTNVTETHGSSHGSAGTASQRGWRRPPPIRTDGAEMPVHDSPFSSPPNLGAGATDLFRSRDGRNSDGHERDAAEQRISRSLQPEEQKLMSAGGTGKSSAGGTGKSSAVRRKATSVSPHDRFMRHENSASAERMVLPLSRDSYSPSNLRVMYSRRGSKSGRDGSRSPSQPPYTESAPSTPRGCTISGGAESQGCSSPVAIVTSTRPVSSQIVLPPTPQLVQFDHVRGDDSPDRVCQA